MKPTNAAEKFHQHLASVDAVFPKMPQSNDQASWVPFLAEVFNLGEVLSELNNQQGLIALGGNVYQGDVPGFRFIVNPPDDLNTETVYFYPNGVARISELHPGVHPGLCVVTMHEPWTYKYFMAVPLSEIKKLLSKE